jgi:pyridoxal kinase
MLVAYPELPVPPHCSDHARARVHQFGGLEANALTAGYTHLLTGYIGNVSFLQHLLEIVAKLRAVNPALVFVCDPVMGDDGKLYVPEELVKVYRESVVSLATVLTPNQFECELLSECAISDVPSALHAMDVLHAKGPRVIFLTSSSFGDAETELTVLISSATAGTHRKPYHRTANILTGSFHIVQMCVLNLARVGRGHCCCRWRGSYGRQETTAPDCYSKALKLLHRNGAWTHPAVKVASILLRHHSLF